MPPPKPRPTLPPRLSRARHVEVVTADPASLRDRDHRDGERFEDADLSDRDLTAISFVECELSGLTLTGTKLLGARFADTTITASFAPVLSAARTTWRDVVVEQPRWGSAELFDSELRSVHVRGGKIDYLNLRSSHLIDVLIEDCTVTDLDLGGFRGTRVALRGCRIETLDLTKATCASVDLRSSEIDRIGGLDGLRGTTIDDFQLIRLAPLFASHLGIVVEDQ